ncbi:MAG: hypothetical protein ASARMPREDX12_007541 [Alectoria sarmentosa]|nr:MAG: hypothetical protein ASARMPREDX12_007541 [Alectoria sarmentosa]
MASFGFSIGDFIGIGTLLYQTYAKCKSASGEFQSLAGELHTARLLVDSVRNAVEDVYSDLPHIHQMSLANVMAGLKATLLGLSRQLDRYPNLRPGQGLQMSKLKFSMFENAQETRSKLNLHISMLNVWLSTLICDSMTKALMPIYEPSQMVSVMAQQKTLSETSQYTSLPIDPELFAMQDPVKKWYSYGDKRSIPALGTYTYGSTCEGLGSLQTTVVNYSVSIRGSNIEGNSEDFAGTAQISGNIDRNRGTLRFLKTYVRVSKGKTLPVWEYVGCFTPCGIVGEWHSPGDPAKMAHWRGKFSIWLKEDGDAAPEELEDRLRTLISRGKVLTKSMTRVSARA